MMRVAGVLPTVFLLLSAQLAGPGALGQEVDTRPERTILYVDMDATGPTHDGWTWCTAFTHLQDALDIAMWDITIRVAEGTYTPDRGTGDRLASFRLTSGVAVEGGYAGCGVPDPDERDIELYETILSGDLAGDDIGDLDDPSRNENSRMIVRAESTDATAILDGFTVTGGQGGTGAGMYITGGGPSVRACRFTDNSATGQGGGMYISGSESAIVGCVFERNRAEEGGAINWHSS